MSETAKAAPRKEKVAMIGGREYVSFSTLYKKLATGVSLKTFKGLIESQGVFPAYKTGNTAWYDLTDAKDRLSGVGFPYPHLTSSRSSSP